MKTLEGGLSALAEAFGEGGRVKTRKTRIKDPDRMPSKAGRGKKRETDESVTIPTRPTMAPKTTATVERATVKPPPKEKKKEATVMDQQATARPTRTFKSFGELGAATREEMESCPLCGSLKPREIEGHNRDGSVFRVRPLVCKRCHDNYNSYAVVVAGKLAAGENIVIMSRHQWILSEMDFERFENELKVAEAEKDRLNEVVQTTLRTHGSLPPEVFRPLRDKLQEQTGARRAYGNWKRCYERIKAAKMVRPELEKMVAEEATKNSTKATVVETTAPSSTTNSVEKPNNKVKRTKKA